MTYPEIHIFYREEPTPLAIVDTPGSMFDVGVVTSGGSTYVTACGKHVHAGIAGRGGDVYAISLSSVAVASGASLPPTVGVRVPNPSSLPLAITYDVPRRGSVQLSLFDVAGREVARLVEDRPGPGAGTWVWDGRDRRGREVRPGVYFLRIANAGLTGRSRVTLMP
jgi:hypothetical protein